jgi:hypothetical protein
MSVSCKCFVLSGRGLCDGPITCPEKSKRLWCVIVCDLETSRMRRPWPALGCTARGKKRKHLNFFKLPTASVFHIEVDVLPEDDPYSVETCRSLKKFWCFNSYNFVHLFVFFKIQ